MREYLVENARLRQLSRQHAEERLTDDAYRSARRAIIDALEQGRVESGAAAGDAMPVVTASADAVTGMHQPDDSAVFYKTMPPQVPEAASREEATPVWDDNTQVLALVLVLSLLIALGALVYVFIL